MKVSVIVVTLNEQKNILPCLTSLLHQKYNHGYEVFVIDGGSNDKTHEIIRDVEKKYKSLTLIIKENGTITECRNIGIKNAHYDYVAFTDADCRVPEDWLSRLTNGYKRHAVANQRLAGVGGGNVSEKSATAFQKAVGIAFNSLLGSLGSIQAMPVKKEKKVFSISCSNSLYKKAALEDVGMFSEELGNQGEDWDIGAKLQKKHYYVYGVRNASVWHNFRATPGAFFKNMIFYGDGRMRLMKKHSDIIKKRYVLPLFFIPVFVISLGYFLWKKNPWILLPFLYFPFMLVYSVVIAMKQKNVQYAFNVFYVFLLQHFGYAFGELKGLKWFVVVEK